MPAIWTVCRWWAVNLMSVTKPCCWRTSVQDSNIFIAATLSFPFHYIYEIWNVCVQFSVWTYSHINGLRTECFKMTLNDENSSVCSMDVWSSLCTPLICLELWMVFWNNRRMNYLSIRFGFGYGFVNGMWRNIPKWSSSHVVVRSIFQSLALAIDWGKKATAAPNNRSLMHRWNALEFNLSFGNMYFLLFVLFLLKYTQNSFIFYLRLVFLPLFFFFNFVSNSFVRTSSTVRHWWPKYKRRCKLVCSSQKFMFVYVGINSMRVRACRWSCVQFYCRHSRQVIYIFHRATNVAQPQPRRPNENQRKKIQLFWTNARSSHSYRSSMRSNPNPNIPDFS